MTPGPEKPPTRYYRIDHLTVRQMDATIKTLREQTDGLAASHPLRAVLRKFEQARAEHDGFMVGD